MFRVIKRASIYLISMPVSLAQWRGEIGAFYNNTLTFSKISIFYLLLSLSYGSIFCRLDLIKLPFLIISLILNGIMFFHFEKCRNNNLKIEVYLFSTIYLLIISNLLEYLWVGSRIISLSGDIVINPGPKLNVLNRCFSIRYVMGIQTAYQHTYLQKFLFYQHTFLSTNLMLFASPKLISIPKFHLMTKIWK